MTTDVDATRLAQDLEVLAALDLPGITRFRLQNASSSARLFVRQQVATPAPGVPGHRVRPGEWFPPSGGTFFLGAPGEKVWIWTDCASCPVLLADAH